MLKPLLYLPIGGMIVTVLYCLRFIVYPDDLETPRWYIKRCRRVKIWYVKHGRDLRKRFVSNLIPCLILGVGLLLSFKLLWWLDAHGLIWW